MEWYSDIMVKMKSVAIRWGFDENHLPEGWE